MMTQREFSHLLTSIKALSPEQMQRLRRELDSELAHRTPPAEGQTKKAAARMPSRRARPPDATQPKQQPLSPDELNQRLLAAGLLTRLPDPTQDIDDDEDPPIVIRGEPLSETIIRERR